LCELPRHPVEKAATMRSFIANETRYGYSRQKEANSEKIRIRTTEPASNGLMSEHAFFEYRAKPMSTPHIQEQGEPIHCLIKMEIGAGLRRPRKLLKQEARDLIVFSVRPGPQRRICHSNICEVGEKRLRELGPAADFNRVGSIEIYFYSS
jgi:hypothetical protein